MTRDDFNRTAADEFCVFSVHLKPRAFGQKDPRDQACTFHQAVEGWLAAQDRKTQSGMFACTVRDSNVTIVGNGRTMAQIDAAFAKEIGYVGIRKYAPPAAPRSWASSLRK
ncbi:MAG: hypothetical protein ACAH83_15290 [Alphaproteobacteria bacterium]